MAIASHNRLVLQRLLSECRHLLPRPARRFLEVLLQDERLLERMQFCRCEERGRLRNSVLISTEEGSCWAVLLGNEPDGGRTTSLARARLALEGLDLSVAEVLDRLRPLPIWFLALDETFASPLPGEAPATERTAHCLASVRSKSVRRRALWDQMDAALDAGDRAACERLRELLAQVEE